MIIQDKLFLMYLKNTIEDFKAAGRPDIARKYEPLYKSRELIIPNVTDLIDLILNRERDREVIPNLYKSQADQEINKEHEYMKSYLQQYFDFKFFGCNMISIVKKKAQKK